jgi:hypothetical protein
MEPAPRAGILSGMNVDAGHISEVLWYPPGSYAVFPFHLRNDNGSRPAIPGARPACLNARTVHVQRTGCGRREAQAGGSAGADRAMTAGDVAAMMCTEAEARVGQGRLGALV